MSTQDINPILEEIHFETAEQVLHMLRSGDVSAAEINAATKFLKDNNITATLDLDGDNSKPTVIKLVGDMPFTEEEDEATG